MHVLLCHSTVYTSLFNFCLCLQLFIYRSYGDTSRVASGGTLYTYRIAGIFQGRKPPWISRFYSHAWKFSPQNFRHAIPIYMYTISLAFRESFLLKMLPSYWFSPSKVSRYNTVLLILACNHCMCALFPIAVLIVFCGLFINGPYALITTAVSNDLVRNCTHAYTLLPKIWHKSTSNNCASWSFASSFMASLMQWYLPYCT